MTDTGQKRESIPVVEKHADYAATDQGCSAHERMCVDEVEGNTAGSVRPADSNTSDTEAEEEEETGVRIQVPEGIAPALVDLDGFSSVPRPVPPPRPRIMLWKHLTCSDVRQIRKSTSLSELKEIVGLRCPEMLNSTQTMTSSVLLELLLYVLQYARQHNLTEEQTSVVFSVAKATHDYATATCFGNAADTFSYFRDLMVAHCVNRPPWSLDLFEPADAEQFARYFADTYFRHFSLVKATFTPYVTLDVEIWYDPRVRHPPEQEPPAADGSEAGQRQGSVGADGGSEAARATGGGTT